jgi:hypothetical protein
LRALYLLSLRLGFKQINEATDYLNKSLAQGGDPALFKALTDIAAVAIENAGGEVPDDAVLWELIENNDNIKALVDCVMRSQKKK